MIAIHLFDNMPIFFYIIIERKHTYNQKQFSIVTTIALFTLFFTLYNNHSLSNNQTRYRLACSYKMPLSSL
jgi:hypothetical protein